MKRRGAEEKELANDDAKATPYVQRRANTHLKVSGNLISMEICWLVGRDLAYGE
jgi:hypothetical protein